MLPHKMDSCAASIYGKSTWCLRKRYDLA